MGKQMKPCIVCNGPKERGRQGSRICDTCRNSDEWLASVRERENNSFRRKQYGEQRRRLQGQTPRAIKVRHDGLVWCSQCKEYLEPNNFRRRSFKSTSSRKHCFSAYCFTCQQNYNRNNRLQSLYGVDLDTYSTLLKFQGNVCFICRKAPAGRSLAVDHDHSTGEVRGILCHQCNSGVLGSLGDSVDALKRAIDYLENPPARSILIDPYN